jgi:hypothetical protein
VKEASETEARRSVAGATANRYERKKSSFSKVNDAKAEFEEFNAVNVSYINSR